MTTLKSISPSNSRVCASLALRLDFLMAKEPEDEIIDESSARYAAYASRARTILVAAKRYVAYTSDVGEG